MKKKYLIAIMLFIALHESSSILAESFAVVTPQQVFSTLRAIHKSYQTHYPDEHQKYPLLSQPYDELPVAADRLQEAFLCLDNLQGYCQDETLIGWGELLYRYARQLYQEDEIGKAPRPGGPMVAQPINVSDEYIDTRDLTLRNLRVTGQILYDTVFTASGTEECLIFKDSNFNVMGEICVNENAMILAPVTPRAIQATCSGDLRGASAIDLQMNKQSPTQVASGDFSVIGGGMNNMASGLGADVLGGSGNSAVGSYAAVISGTGNSALGDYSFIGGGAANTASGAFSVIVGGYNNSASGSNSIALGQSADAATDNSFVWADGQITTFTSTISDTFNIRALNGFVMQGDTTDNITLVVPSGLSASYTLTLPINAGMPRQVLTTNGGNSAQLSWTTIPTATSYDIPLTFVLRDSTGSFAATTITLTGASLIDYNTSGGYIWAPTNENTIIGLGAGTGLLGANVIIGYQAGQFLISDTNVIIGAHAGSNITTATGVIVIGGNIPGVNLSNTTYIGGIYGVTTGADNGLPVLIDSNNNLGTVSGNTDTLLGDQALDHQLNQSQNVAIGYQAGFQIPSNNAYQNTVVGAQAGPGPIGSTGLTINNNVIMGYQAQQASPGSANVIIGSQAGLAGNNNIVIGYSAGGGRVFPNGGDGILILGNGGLPFNGSNPEGIGATYIDGIRYTVGTGLDVAVTGAGQLVAVASSARYKENIESMTEVSENIYRLRPVGFNYIQDHQKFKQFGLLAEDVEQVIPEIVIYDKEGRPDAVYYRGLYILMLNEQQKDHKMLLEHQELLRGLQAEISALKKRCTCICG